MLRTGIWSLFILLAQAAHADLPAYALSQGQFRQALCVPSAPSAPQVLAPKVERFRRESPTLWSRLPKELGYESYEALVAAQGEAAAIEHAWLFLRYGFTATAKSAFLPNAIEFTDRERRDLLWTLEALPESLFPSGSESRPLHRIDRTANTFATGLIVLFNRWAALGSEGRRYILTHELGHVFAGDTLDVSSRWKELAQRAPVSIYGQKDSAEDFAESFALYRYDPRRLKGVSPEKYAFLRDLVFDGLEYDSVESCDPARAWSRQALSKVEVPKSAKPSSFLCYRIAPDSAEGLRCRETLLRAEAAQAQLRRKLGAWPSDLVDASPYLTSLPGSLLRSGAHP